MCSNSIAQDRPCSNSSLCFFPLKFDCVRRLFFNFAKFFFLKFHLFSIFSRRAFIQSHPKQIQIGSQPRRWGRSGLQGRVRGQGLLVPDADRKQLRHVCRSQVSVIRLDPMGCDIDDQWLFFSSYSYEAGRITRLDDDPKGCSIKIKNVEDKDNGDWECTVAGQNPRTQEFSTGAGVVSVTVAMAPSDVYLRLNDVRVNGPLIKELTGKDNMMQVQCVAENTRPAPHFTWYIGNTKLKVNNKITHMVQWIQWIPIFTGQGCHQGGGCRSRQEELREHPQLLPRADAQRPGAEVRS